MNDLFSSSFSRNGDHSGDIEMGHGTGTQVNLDKFFEDVEVIKTDLQELDDLQHRLSAAHEESKTVHKAGVVKELRSRMDRDVTQALKKAKVIKDRLEALNKSNADNLKVPGCGVGSSTERTRTAVVSGLGTRLKARMEEFQKLRHRINEEYKDTVQRRYFTVTGESPDEKTVDRLISTGESETFLQKAIQQQGRGQVLDTIAEIQERHDAVQDIEKNLQELHQVFLDMASLVHHQGAQLDSIEAHVQRANSTIMQGTTQLVEARKSQKSTRKWTVFAIILLLIIILIVVLSLRPWTWSK